MNAYDEYGIPRSTNVGRFQYTGQQWIAELGLYHYRARIYSPTLGRFLQTDPIGYGGGMNLYAYVGNDPVNFTDPSGLGKDPGDTPPPKCVGDYCGNTGGTIVVTGPSIPEPKTPEAPLPTPTVIVGSGGIPSNEGGGGGVGEGGDFAEAGNPRRRRQVIVSEEQCRIIAEGMLTYFIIGYAAKEGMEAAVYLSRLRGAGAAAGAEVGGAVGARAGWIGAAIGAVTGAGLAFGYPAFKDYFINQLCPPSG